MKRRWRKLLGAALFAWVALYALEKIAEAQTTAPPTTGTGGFGGGGGGGSLLSGGSGMSGAALTISGGNSQGFSGGQSASFSGGSASGAGGGGAGAGARGAAGSTTTIPAASNVFGPNYINPFSRGIKSTSGTMATGTYNQPIYAPQATTSAKTTTNRGRTTNTTNANSSFTTAGVERSIPYATGLSEDLPIFRPETSALQAELTDIIQRSSKVTSKDKITVAVDKSGVVLLRGEVASARERGEIERMLSIEPGVRFVDNQLSVAGNNKQ